MKSRRGGAWERDPFVPANFSERNFRVPTSAASPNNPPADFQVSGLSQERFNAQVLEENEELRRLLANGAADA